MAHGSVIAAISDIACLARRLEAPKAETSHLSDEALMLRYQGGDDASFALLYHRYRARLHRFVSRIAGQADSDEIFQDVWLAVIRSRAQYQPTARFVTFLFTIAHRRAADCFRKIGRAPTVVPSGEDGDFADDHLGPFDEIQNAQLGKALAEAIAGLPLVQREAFLMKAEGGLALDEIAEATGAPRETVKSRLRYAQRSLRRSLETWR